MALLALPVFRHFHPGNVAKDTVNSFKERAKPQLSAPDPSPYQLHERSLMISKAAARESWNRTAGEGELESLEV